MFQKKQSINVDKFSSFMPFSARLYMSSQDTIILVNDDAEQIHLKIYNISGDKKGELTVENSYGLLMSILSFDGHYWLEFQDTVAPYIEEYTVLKVNEDSSEVAASFIRESYQHDMPYHSLFVKNNELYLNFIRHNRLHQYIIDKENGVQELDVLEGGKWYLCGKYSLCYIRDVIELYDADLSLYNTIDYENEIDELQYCENRTSSMLALTLTDLSQEQTALLVQNQDNDIVHISYLEHTIANMGISAGRIWLNPYSFMEQQELGGCMIYDKYALPLYVHLRVKNTNTINIGSYPPPFHRSEKIVGIIDDVTLVVEGARILLFDYSCRPVQELQISSLSCMAIKDTGDAIAVLNLNGAQLDGENANEYENVTIDIYQFDSKLDDDKVVKLSKFTR